MLCSTVRTDNVVLDVDLTNPDIKRGEVLELAKDTVHVARAKFLWKGELLRDSQAAQLRRADAHAAIAFEFDADFADLFEIRGHQRRRAAR